MQDEESEETSNREKSEIDSYTGVSIKVCHDLVIRMQLT